MSERSLDLVVYGATGFSGTQTARYLDKRAPRGLRWAIAGRSREKLEALRSTLTDPSVGVVVADASAPETLAAMARQTRAIISTVGPFRRYGTPLVAACVEERTHYADITGETPWARSIIEAFDARARERGVKLVPFSGYDSMPSDIGTFAVLERARQTRGVGLRRAEAFHSARGGFNGGTLATSIDMSSDGGRGLRDPWLLSPGFTPSAAARAFDRDVTEVRFHAQAEVWTAPFLMAPFNTRVVRRSAALAPELYGRDFAYQEYWATRSRAKAWAMLAGLGALMGAMRTSAGRTVAAKLGPKPGEGPSESAMAGGFFQVRYLAEAEDGTIFRARMHGDGDPGNRSTARFLVEAGLLLADDALPAGGGVLTPALAFGARILERAAPHGLTFTHE